MADRLPEEVLIDILARLTVEDLVRCITVSKPWYSLITSPSFISFHVKRIRADTANTSLLLIMDYDFDYFDGSDETRKQHFSIYFDDSDTNTFGFYKRLDFPFKSLNPKFRLIGCLNGVVCLSDDDFCYGDIILWNPSINKSVTLPKPLVSYQLHGSFMQAVGFGYSTITNDYKVVRVVNLERRKDMVPPMVEVYELRVGSWRIIDCEDFPYVVDGSCSQTFLNGAIHWSGFGNGENGPFYNVIVSFDLEKEVLGVMKMPNCLADEYVLRDTRFLIVSQLGESLSLIHRDSTSHAYIFSSCIWVMKQYGLSDSWTKLFTVDLTGNLRGVFGYRKNGEALLSVRNYEETSIVSYDPKSKQLKYLDKLQSHRSFNVENCVESLSLLGVKGESTMKATNSIVPSKGYPDVDADKHELEDKEEEEEKEIIVPTVKTVL